MPLMNLINNTLGLASRRKPRHKRKAFPDFSAAPPDSRRLISNRQYSYILANDNFDETSIACGWKALQHDMAFVPGGHVRMHHETVTKYGGGCELEEYIDDPMDVDAIYLDRHCVSNADYQRFIQDGGYERAQLWPEDILAMVLQFNDATGQSGPRYWKDGNPPPDRLNHPVVGVCWYEANAYANWIGKRLPTSAEWQRAGTWPMGNNDSAEPRYPWGNAFDPGKANLWTHDDTATIATDAMADGATPNGVRQLIGNVWEWVDAQYAPATEGDDFVELDDLMAEVRGGAFDTYFASQATCQFRTGQPVHRRAANVGFRCCISVHDLNNQPALPSMEKR